MIVPKHRRTVVQRNKLKRRLREVLRRDILPQLRNLDHGVDVLIRARREAYEATFSELREELMAWTERKWSRAH